MSKSRPKFRGKVPVQAEFNFNAVGFSKAPTKPKPIKHNIVIKGISPDKITKVLAESKHFPPQLLSELKTRAHVEQQIRILIAEIKQNNVLLESRRMHHTQITELQQENLGYSLEKRVLEKLLE